MKNELHDEILSRALRENDMATLTDLVQQNKINDYFLSQPYNRESSLQSWDTPIVFAARTSNLEMLHLFLSVPHVGRLYIANDDYSPFRHALLNDNQAILSELLTHCKFNVLTLSVQDSSLNADHHPLTLAITLCAHQCLEELLVNKGVGINYQPIHFERSAYTPPTVFHLIPTSNPKHEKTRDVLLNYYFNKMIKDEKGIRELLMSQPELLAELAKNKEQLWKKCLNWAAESLDQGMDLLWKIHDSESYEIDQQHPLYWVFSSKNMTTYEYMCSFWSTPEDIMSKIREICRKKLILST